MAKIVIDCPDPNNPDVDGILKQVEKRGCSVKYFHDAEALQQSGNATSRRDAARKIAEHTGENPSAVETKIRRGETKVRHPDAVEEVQWSRGPTGVWEKKAALREKYPSKYYSESGPKLKDIGDVLPPDYEEYQEIGEALGLVIRPVLADVPDYARLPSIETLITSLMREISRRGVNKQKKVVRSFFNWQKEIRNRFDLCWRCLRNKPATVKHGLCGGCVEKEAQDKEQALFNAKLEKRGINDKSTQAWQGVFDEIEVLVNKVATLLEQESPPKISQEQAEFLIQAGRHLDKQIGGSVLYKLAYSDCYT